MIPVLTAAEMRQADRRTIEEVGLPGVVLMENAGAAVAAEIERRWGRGPVLIVTGKGNNGGDGFVAARRLGARAETLLLARSGDVKGDARAHLGALVRSGGRVEEVPDEAAWEQVSGRLGRAAVVVDAVLGTGLRSRPEGLPGRAVAGLAALASAGGPPVVAVDIPSGVPSDTGAVDWATASATVTVTFAAPKRGHVLAPACERCGALVVADIGIPRALLEGAALGLVEGADALAAFPARDADAHKGRFGHLLVVAGSFGKSGAAVLAATGALRAGAGLVTVATPETALPMVAAGRAELMTEPLPVEPDGGLGPAAAARCAALAADRDAVVLGPGLGLQGATPGFVRELAAACGKPLLVDADGLNALADPAGRGATAGRGAPTVLTPHPGEAGRLLGSSAREVQGARLEGALELARQRGAVVALKGHRTLIAEPGGRAAVNASGGPELATGGTGDVLSGVIGALLARGLGAWEAAVAGVHLHGLAGEHAAERLGPEATLALDVAEALGPALRRLRSGAGA